MSTNYNKWLKPLLKPTQAPTKNVREQLNRYAAELDSMKDVPARCRWKCATAKVQGLKETENATGCEWCLPLQENCRECPRWSESRYGAAVGRLIGVGFTEGIKETERTEVES